MRFLLVAALFLFSVPAKAAIVTTNLIATVTSVSLPPNLPSNDPGSDLLGLVFNLTTTIDTSVGSFSDSGSGYAFVDPAHALSAPPIPDSAFAAGLGDFGGYTAQSTISGNSIEQRFESLGNDHGTQVFGGFISFDTTFDGDGSGTFSIWEGSIWGYYTNGTFSIENGSVQISSIPEPSTWVLMLLGFVGLIGFSRCQPLKSANQR